MKLNRLAVLSLIALVAACDSGGPGSSSASDGAAKAVDEKAAYATRERQSVFVLMKKNFMPLVGMVRGKVPYDAALAQKSATRLSQLIPMIADGFVMDTRGSGVETEALDNIWDEKDKFIGKMDAAVDAANNLVANAGSEATYGDAFKKLGEACGSCHDDFRVEQE